RGPGRPQKGATDCTVSTAGLGAVLGIGERMTQTYLQVGHQPQQWRDAVRGLPLAQNITELSQLAGLRPPDVQRAALAYLVDRPKASVHDAEQAVRYRYRPCQVCGAHLDAFSYNRAELHHCAKCQNHWEVGTQPFCPQCAEPLPGHTTSATAT